METLFPPVEEPFALHNTEVFTDIRLSLAGSLDQFLNIHFTMDLQLVQQLKPHGFAQNLKSLSDAFQQLLRQELLAHN